MILLLSLLCMVTVPLLALDSLVVQLPLPIPLQRLRELPLLRDSLGLRHTVNTDKFLVLLRPTPATDNLVRHNPPLLALRTPVLGVPPVSLIFIVSYLFS